MSIFAGTNSDVKKDLTFHIGSGKVQNMNSTEQQIEPLDQIISASITKSDREFLDAQVLTKSYRANRSDIVREAISEYRERIEAERGAA